MTRPHNKIDSPECAVPTCDRPRLKQAGGAFRYCAGHKGRLARNGRLDEHIPLRAVHSGRFDEWCDYRTAHNRIKNARGRAAEFKCIDCKAPAKEWSYRGGARYEFSGAINGKPGIVKWSGDPADYDPRCKSCHSTQDRTRKRN